MLSTLLLFGFSYALLLCVGQVKKAIHDRYDHIFIIGLSFIAAVELFYGWMYYSGTIYDYPFLLRVNTPLTFATGPILYLALRTLLSGKEVVTHVAWLHALPILLCFAYFVPLVAAPVPVKLAYIDQLYAGPEIDSYLWGGLRRVQQGVYILLMGGLLIKSGTKPNLHFRVLMQKRPLLFVFVLLFVALWLSSIYRYLFHFTFVTGVYDVLLVGMLISGILIYGIVTETMHTGKFSNKLIANRKENELANILDNIVVQMEEELVYRDAGLTLTGLSRKMGCPPREISRAINSLLDQNFNELVNRYRVNFAKQLLQDPENSHKTIEALAGEAGFGSISAFNDNFKKMTGTTPSRVMLK